MNKQSPTKEAPMPSQDEISDYVWHHADILDTIEALSKFANAMPQPTQNGTRLDVSQIGLRTARYIAIKCREIQQTITDLGPIK
jgi:hypothetical protein